LIDVEKEGVGPSGDNMTQSFNKNKNKKNKNKYKKKKRPEISLDHFVD